MANSYEFTVDVEGIINVKSKEQVHTKIADLLEVAATRIRHRVLGSGIVTEAGSEMEYRVHIDWEELSKPLDQDELDYADA